MSNNEKEIEEQLKELSDLEDKIRNDIEKYNRLSSQIDTCTRLALMTADYEKYDDDEDRLTHDQCVKNSDYPPRPRIHAPDAYYWFPSAICSGF